MPPTGPGGNVTGVTFFAADDAWSDYFMVTPGGRTDLDALDFFTGGPLAAVADVPEFHVNYNVPAGLHSLDLKLDFGVTFNRTDDDSTVEAETTNEISVQVTDDFLYQGDITVTRTLTGNPLQDIVRLEDSPELEKAALFFRYETIFDFFMERASLDLVTPPGLLLELPQAQGIESVVEELQGIVVLAQAPVEQPGPTPLYAPQVTLSLRVALPDGAVPQASRLAQDVALTEIDVPVDITWSIPGNVATPASVQIYRVEESVATALPTSVDIDANTASASSPNSGTFVLVPARLLTVELQAGTNRFPYTGAPGADPSILLNRLADADALGALFQFDAPTQGWLVWRPGAPAFLNSLDELGANAPLFLQLSRATMWSGPANPWAAGQWSLVPGFTAVTFLGPDATAVNDALAQVGDPSALDAIFRLDAATQTWQSFRPGQPAFLNTFETLNRFDVLMVLASQPTAWAFDAVDP